MKAISLSILILLTLLPTCVAAISPQTKSKIVAKPFSHSAMSATNINAASARAAIKKMEAVLKASTGISYSAALTLTAPVVGVPTPKNYMATVSVEKAGNASIKVTGPDGAYQQMLADGKTVTVYDSALGKYSVADAGTTFASNVTGIYRSGRALYPTDPGQFFKLEMGLVFPTYYTTGHFDFGTSMPGVIVKLLHKNIVVDGKPADFVTEKLTTQRVTIALSYTIDPGTNLPLSFSVTTITADGQVAVTIAETFSDLHLLTAPAAPSNYAFVPPARSTLVAATPSPSDSSSAAPSKLLTAGTVAPDFTVTSATNSPVKLSDFKGKVVVVDFWATWCGPCQESLPHTDIIARVWAPKGVVFLPICSWDTKDSFTTWLKAHKKMAMSFYFDPAGSSDNNICATLYGVDGIPTQYVIGSDGKVLTSFVGYDSEGDPDESALVAVLRKATAGS